MTIFLVSKDFDIKKLEEMNFRTKVHVHLPNCAKSQTGVQVPYRITCLQPLQFKSLPFYDNFVHWHNMSQHCGSACSSLWPLSKHQGAWPGNPGQGSTASDPVKILIKIII